MFGFARDQQLSFSTAALGKARGGVATLLGASVSERMQALAVGPRPVGPRLMSCSSFQVQLFQFSTRVTRLE